MFLRKSKYDLFDLSLIKCRLFSMFQHSVSVSKWPSDGHLPRLAERVGIPYKGQAINYDNYVDVILENGTKFAAEFAAGKGYIAQNFLKVRTLMLNISL